MDTQEGETYTASGPITTGGSTFSPREFACREPAFAVPARGDHTYGSSWYRADLGELNPAGSTTIQVTNNAGIERLGFYLDLPVPHPSPASGRNLPLLGCIELAVDEDKQVVFEAPRGLTGSLLVQVIGDKRDGQADLTIETTHAGVLESAPPDLVSDLAPGLESPVPEPPGPNPPANDDIRNAIVVPVDNSYYDLPGYVTGSSFQEGEPICGWEPSDGEKYPAGYGSTWYRMDVGFEDGPLGAYGVLGIPVVYGIYVRHQVNVYVSEVPPDLIPEGPDGQELIFASIIDSNCGSSYHDYEYPEYNYHTGWDSEAGPVIAYIQVIGPNDSTEPAQIHIRGES